ncbi:hypothetical protein, partial [Nostoc sp. CALU 1950]|uniref:hypothetical protein n=1 Tax=Nostoc sp. CALU 1950 TaxID=3104321 RepID=UPI003EBBB1ED
HEVLRAKGYRVNTLGRASFKYIPSFQAGNETTQVFGLFLVPFGYGSFISGCTFGFKQFFLLNWVITQNCRY